MLPKALLSVAIAPRLFYSLSLATSESLSRLGCFLVLRKIHSFSKKKKKKKKKKNTISLFLLDTSFNRFTCKREDSHVIRVSTEFQNVPCVPWGWAEELC